MKTSLTGVVAGKGKIAGVGGGSGLNTVGNDMDTCNGCDSIGATVYGY